jgi:hypothetical protein
MTSMSVAANTLNANGNVDAVPLPVNGPAIRVVLEIVIYSVSLPWGG